MYGYKDPVNFFISKLSEGIATIGAAFNNKPVIVRMSDFKSNEYANLIGGKQFEPKEENPMLGFRGAGRYVSEAFKDCFQLECEAFKKVRNEMGLKNMEIAVNRMAEGGGFADLLTPELTGDMPGLLTGMIIGDESQPFYVANLGAALIQVRK